jgi:hypothetical protein
VEARCTKKRVKGKISIWCGVCKWPTGNIEEYAGDKRESLSKGRYSQPYCCGIDLERWEKSGGKYRRNWAKRKESKVELRLPCLNLARTEVGIGFSLLKEGPVGKSS